MMNQHIFVLSDSTADTAMKIMRAALLQFQHEGALVTRYGNVRSPERITEVIQEARRYNAFILYTFVSEDLRIHLKKSCEGSSVVMVDLLGPLMERLSRFFETAPQETPGLLHQVDESYFQRIEAIEYTVRHDDGRLVSDLEKADIVLVGVSRASKTPLGMYLAQEGWRTANIPIIPGRELPEEIAQLDPLKVVGLIIDPRRLVEVRQARLARLGAKESNYADLQQVEEELKWAQRIFARNPEWKIIDVTRKSVEESAAEILDHLLGKERKI
jgi:[pyruvate, water dikinase]-phosphate phosphotransferase / [pyruvate, water dikinase] kinase